MNYYEKSNNRNYEFQISETFASNYEARDMVAYLEYMGCGNIILLSDRLYFDHEPKGPYQRACEDFEMFGSPAQEHNDYQYDDYPTAN